MGEAVFFRNLTTKGLTAINSGERYFEGWLTVQVKDKQGEVTIVDELMKVLPVWIDRGAPISDTHSNRIIGKGINYSKSVYKDTDGEEYPAIKVTGKIHKNYELDNDIWGKIKSGEYKGLSFGGATKSDRVPMQMKDGSIAYSLKDLEHYEVAVCRDPAVPLALITEFNTLAKSAVEGEDIGGGRMLIKCSKYGCYVEKDNKEAGLKAPEAAREALVYDDKTLDQPSETPKVVEDLGKDKNYGSYCTSCGQRKPHTEKVGGQILESGERATEFMAQDEETSKSPTCPTCTAQAKKGEDFSNADGDRHSMYNQDTDEGGMGKHKQKREVGTGYGAEQNSTGEVGWSGGGSPYPKHAAMVNVITRLKSLKLNNKYHSNVHAGVWDVPSGPQGGKRDIDIHSLPDNEAKITYDNRLMHEYLQGLPKREREAETRRKRQTKKKEGEFGGMNQGETEWTEPRDTANDRRDSNFKKKPQI